MFNMQPVKVCRGNYVLEAYKWSETEQAGLIVANGSEPFWRYRVTEDVVWGETNDQDYPFDEFDDIEDFVEFINYQHELNDTINELADSVADYFAEMLGEDNLDIQFKIVL